MTTRENQVHLGALLMLLGIALLAAMDASAKWMVLDNIHPLQLLAVRSVVIVIVLIVGYSIRNNLSELRPTRPWIQALRGTSGIIAPLSFFLSLKYLPLTDAVVVFFTSVFAITIISAYFLGERVGWHRWSAVILGYFGVAIAMAPTGSGAIAGYALVLVSSISYAGLFTSGRWLSETESVSSLVFSYNAGVGLIACCLLPFLWTSMNATEWVLLMLLSGFAVAGHFAITYAFSLAEASAIAPFEYTAIIWALLFDYYIWGSIPPLTTCAGAALIISSGLYVLHRENKNRQAGR